MTSYYVSGLNFATALRRLLAPGRTHRCQPVTTTTCGMIKGTTQKEVILIPIGWAGEPRERATNHHQGIHPPCGCPIRLAAPGGARNHSSREQALEKATYFIRCRDISRGRRRVFANPENRTHTPAEDRDTRLSAGRSPALGPPPAASEHPILEGRRLHSIRVLIRNSGVARYSPLAFTLLAWQMTHTQTSLT